MLVDSLPPRHGAVWSKLILNHVVHGDDSIKSVVAKLLEGSNEVMEMFKVGVLAM